MSAALVALALAASDPPSLLGAVVAGDDDVARAVLDACPRVAVFPLSNPAARVQIAAYKAACPEGIAIARVGTPHMPVDATTLAAAGRAWEAQIRALHLTPGQDGVEGPSEPVGSPAALAAFWSRFALFVNVLNLRPVVGALPSNPPGLGSRRSNPFCATVDALRFPGTLTWWWSYHARSPTMTTNADREASTSLGYRRVRADCSLVGVPLLLTEAGPAGRGWRASDAEWIAWLAARLAEDGDVPGTPGVKGAALVAVGPGASPDLAPLLPDLLLALARGREPESGRPRRATSRRRSRFVTRSA